MALTERVHSDTAIPPGRKCFLLMEERYEPVMQPLHYGSYYRNWCWQWVRVTHQRSGLRLVVWFGSVPDPANDPTRCVLAGLLPGTDINPWFFGQVGPGLQFHNLVPATLAPIKYMCCDRIVS